MSARSLGRPLRETSTPPFVVVEVEKLAASLKISHGSPVRDHNGRLDPESVASSCTAENGRAPDGHRHSGRVMWF